MAISNEQLAMCNDNTANKKSKLDELIQKYCPNGVEYKKLSDISIQFNGMTGVSKKWENEGNCQFIDYLNAYNNIKIVISNTPYATVKNKDKQKVLIKGDILCTCASETPDECAISSVIEDEISDVLFLDDHLFGIRPINKSTYNSTFLNYYFHTNEFRKKVNKAVRGVTRFYISNPDFMKITVPVPPLPVQEEIVRILDSFTSLTAELQAELQARKKQYEYYRETLYSKYEDMPKERLINLANISRGVRVVKTQLNDEGKYPVFQNSLAPMGYYDKTNCKQNTTYVISAGAAGEIGFCENNFWAADDCLVFTNLKELRNKYIYYFLLTKQNYIKSNVRKASIPRLSRTVIENLSIPVIPLQEQDKLIDLLSRFDSLCNDLSSGLPAEIEARQKQYEYYRDKLLTFKQL